MKNPRGGVVTTPPPVGVFDKRGVTFLPVGVCEKILQQKTCNWTPNRYARAKKNDLKTKKNIREKPLVSKAKVNVYNE